MCECDTRVQNGGCGVAAVTMHVFGAHQRRPLREDRTDSLAVHKHQLHRSEPCAHAHTHTHTHTHTNTHTHTHTHTQLAFRLGVSDTVGANMGQHHIQKVAKKPKKKGKKEAKDAGVCVCVCVRACVRACVCVCRVSCISLRYELAPNRSQQDA
jgi:hypothetical protein